MIKTSDGVVINLEANGIRCNKIREYENETGRHIEQNIIYISYTDLDKINSDREQIKNVIKRTT